MDSFDDKLRKQGEEIHKKAYDNQEKIAEVLRLLDKILRAKKEEFGFSYPEMNSSLVHDHFKKIKEILEK